MKNIDQNRFEQMSEELKQQAKDNPEITNDIEYRYKWKSKDLVPDQTEEELVELNKYMNDYDCYGNYK